MGKTCTNLLIAPLQDPRLSIEAKAIYAYLHELADLEGKAYPYTNTLCEELGISEHRFLKHRKRLIELGYISSMERLRQEGGCFGQVVYTLNDDPEWRVCCE